MKIEMYDSGYKLSDLYIAAALLCESNAELDSVSQPDKSRKQVLFAIKGTHQELKLKIDDYFNGKLPVDARKFTHMVQDLKSRIYEVINV